MAFWEKGGSPQKVTTGNPMFIVMILFQYNHSLMDGTITAQLIFIECFPSQRIQTFLETTAKMFFNEYFQWGLLVVQYFWKPGPDLGAVLETSIFGNACLHTYKDHRGAVKKKNNNPNPAISGMGHGRFCNLATLRQILFRQINLWSPDLLTPQEKSWILEVSKG